MAGDWDEGHPAFRAGVAAERDRAARLARRSGVPVRVLIELLEGKYGDPEVAQRVAELVCQAVCDTTADAIAAGPAAG